jgi:hypothetical protein
MAKFRKKPVVIEAWQWRPEVKSGDIPMWLIMANYDLDGVDLLIKTLEGTMRASPDDWIIKGVKEEIYPCKPDIFAATYEPAE